MLPAAQATASSGHRQRRRRDAACLDRVRPRAYGESRSTPPTEPVGPGGERRCARRLSGAARSSTRPRTSSRARSCSSRSAAPATRSRTPTRPGRSAPISTTRSARIASTASRARRSRAWSTYWIRYPDTEGVMPAMLYKGQEAQDVAAYVGSVAAKPGVDTGALASAGGVTGTTPAAGKAVFTGVGGCGSCHTLAAAGHDRHRRAEPRQGSAHQLRLAAVEEDPRRDAAEVHRDGDHQAVRLPPAGLQGRRHARQLRQDADQERDHGARQLHLQRREVELSARRP